MNQDEINKLLKQSSKQKPEPKPEVEADNKQKMKLTFTVYYEADPAIHDDEIDVSNEWLLAQADRDLYINGDLSLDDLHNTGRDPVISVEPFRGTWVDNET